METITPPFPAGKAADAMNEQEKLELISKSAEDSRSALEDAGDRLAARICEAAAAIVETVRSGGRVLVCGNGGSAADSQHMAAELVGRFLLDRAPYAAVSLTTDTSVLTSLSNDYGFESVFERQVRALGGPGSALVAISTSGNSGNVLNAMSAAREMDMKVIALTGRGGGKMAEVADVLIDAASGETPRIQEVHGFAIHVICDLVEKELSGG